MKLNSHKSINNLEIAKLNTTEKQIFQYLQKFVPLSYFDIFFEECSFIILYIVMFFTFFLFQKRGDLDVDDDVEDDVNENSSSECDKETVWNIGHYPRFVSYICMGFFAYYCNSLLFQYIGLVL